MRTLAVALLLALPLTAIAAPAEQRPVSRIEAVTVYQGAARVTRRASVDLPRGNSRVLFEGLPDGLADDSVRVEGKGVAGTQVFGVTVERQARAVSDDADARAAREAVEKLEAEDRALEDRRTAAQDRKALLESLRSTWVSERAENLAVKRVEPREWSSLLDFSTKELGAVLAELRAIDEAKRELARRLAASRDEQRKVQAKAGTFRKTVTVELEASQGGAVALDVTYLVYGASWGPVWDARLDSDTGALRMELRASIAQQTGEDWPDVRLEVSTSTPNRSLAVPELATAWLDRIQSERVSASEDRVVFKKKTVVDFGDVTLEGELAKPEGSYSISRSAPVEQAVVLPEAAIQEGLLSASFRIPRRETVEGTGRAARAFLADFPFTAELIRLASPRIDRDVYLLATAKNEAPTPLLSGPVSLYVDREFVGRARLPTVAPGDEVKLAFGADDRVKVERMVVERFRDTRGLLGKDDSIRYKIRTTVKNLHGRPVTVKIVDQIPVSRDGDVRVDLLDGTTRPTEKEDPMKPGVRVHLVELPAKGEKAIELAYEVRWPKSLAITGLE